MKNRPIAVVAVSGGLDSCVTLAIAAQSYEPAMLHINYGQRTEKKELECFHKIADFYEAQLRLATSLPHFKEIKGSSLLDPNAKIEKGKPDKNRIPSTYVPFRNASILCVAVSWAEVIGAGKVFIGAVEEDSSGYPDCRPAFFRAFEECIKQGTRPESRIKIETPIINMTKAEIIKKGVSLGAPLHLTWSCYTDSEQACGECESCYLRLKAFLEAGIEDQIPYKTKPGFTK